MDGSISDEQAHVWLQDIADAGWISLHYDNPVLGGPERAEIIGGGYVRVKMAFSQPANRAIWALTDARYTGLVQTKLTHFGIWDKKNKGMLRASAELPEPAVVLNGKGYVIPAGRLAVSIG